MIEPFVGHRMIPIPRPFEARKILFECREQRRAIPCAPAQFTIIVTIRLVLGNIDKFTMAKVRETREPCRSQGQSQLAARSVLAGKRHPAILRQLVGDNVLRSQVWWS